MDKGGYQIRNQNEIHFLSFATVGWVDVFSRRHYRDIVLESLRHCQQKKGLRMHAWCLMTNHLHLLASSGIGDLYGTLRDLKKFTGSEIIKAIQNSRTEIRKEWMLELFRNEGAKNSRNKEYQFWRQDNQPKECFSNAFTVQKLNYIHNNPVEAGIVEKPEHYLYSSARDYVNG